MADFPFRIVGDATHADKAIDDVLDGLEDIKRKANDTGKGLDNAFQKLGNSMKSVDSQSKAIRASIGQFGDLKKQVGETTGIFGKFKGGMQAVGGAMAPFNQGIELAGKVVRFAEAGLDAYAKTSERAAGEVKALKKEFGEWRDFVMSSTGEMTVALLKPATSIDATKKKLQELLEMREKFRKGGFGAFREVAKAPFLLGDDETLDPLVNLGDAWSKFEEEMRGTVDYWNTGGKSFVEGAAKAWEDQAKAIEKAKEQAKEYARIGRALVGGESASARAIRQGELERTAFQAAVEADARADMTDIDWNAMRQNISASADGAHDMANALSQIKKDQVAEELKKIQETGREMGEAFAPLGNAITDMFRDGTFSAEAFVDALDEIAIKLAIMGLVSAAGTGGFGSFLSGMFGVPGHATGAQFMVGGASGTDQNLVAFRASNDERVTIETPQQVRDGTFSGGAGPLSVAVLVRNDPREIEPAITSRSGQRAIARVNRKFNRRR